MMFLLCFGAVFAIIVACGVVNFMVRSLTLSPTGKCVLITGCDRGFGFLLAVQLSSGLPGFRRLSECCRGGASTLQLTSSNLEVIQLDVTNDQQVADARNFVEDRLEGYGLWAVVNNAGIGAFADAEWCPMWCYRAVMEVNWLGTVRVTQAFLPLVTAVRGRVINVASLAGRVALPGLSSYSSSKFAVVGFSDSLRREMDKFGVKVITIEPSVYRTAFVDSGTLTGQATRMWAETSQEVRHRYGDAYLHNYLAKLNRLLRYASTKIYEVVDDVTHAVTSAHPYRRYVPVLLVNQLPTDLFSTTPNFVQDWVLDWIFRVPVDAEAARSSACIKKERNRLEFVKYSFSLK